MTALWVQSFWRGFFLTLNKRCCEGTFLSLEAYPMQEGFSRTSRRQLGDNFRSEWLCLSEWTEERSLSWSIPAGGQARRGEVEVLAPLHLWQWQRPADILFCDQTQQVLFWHVEPILPQYKHIMKKLIMKYNSKFHDTSVFFSSGTIKRFIFSRTLNAGIWFYFQIGMKRHWLKRGPICVHLDSILSILCVRVVIASLEWKKRDPEWFTHNSILVLTS